MRTSPLSRRIAFVAAAGLAAACSAKKTETTGSPTPTATATPTPGPGARVLSISADPANLPNPSTPDFINAFTEASSLGCKGQFTSYTWAALEAAPGVYGTANLANGLSYIQSLGFTSQYLGIQMINTNAKSVPTDLAAVAWDDSAMINRFHALVDAITPGAAGKIQYFSVGNEVDVYLAAQNQWGPFQTFYDDAVSYIHTKLPGVKVGTTFTYAGANSYTANMNTLTASSDIMIFTDYPLGANFVPLGPEHGSTDLQGMVTLAGSKQIVVQEFGYPSDSTLLSSSQEEQAQFFGNGLRDWQAIGGAKIPFLNIFLEHEFAQSECLAFEQQYGLSGNANFGAYLCSIGLRNVDDSPKLAWTAVLNTAGLTGF